jgi:hypothetical protein
MAFLYNASQALLSYLPNPFQPSYANLAKSQRPITVQTHYFYSPRYLHPGAKDTRAWLRTLLPTIFSPVNAAKSSEICDHIILKISNTHSRRWPLDTKISRVIPVRTEHETTVSAMTWTELDELKFDEDGDGVAVCDLVSFSFAEKPAGSVRGWIKRLGDKMLCQDVWVEVKVFEEKIG